MTRIILRLTVFLAMQSLLYSADSALQWEHKVLEFRPAPSDKKVQAEFQFTNIGKQPVSIDSVRSSCGCTTVALEKKTYEPGEKGHVTALFTIGSRRGLQVKAVRVVIHGEHDPVMLTMVTRLPVSLKIEPEFVFWQCGDAPLPKTMKLVIPSDSQLQVTKVTSNNPKIVPTLETVKEGREYRIVVTPDGTATPAMAILTLDTVVSSKEAQVFHAYAQVKGPAKQQPAR